MNPTSTLPQLIESALTNKASDIHLQTGAPPYLRILGELCPLNMPPQSALQIVAMYHQMQRSDQQAMQKFSEDDYPPNHKADLPYTDPNTQRRLRVNAYRTLRGPALAMRLIPATIASLDQIAAPEIVRNLASRPRGLILVTGPTGSGKSATLAAMIDYINRDAQKHILTIEDPIEHIHQNRRSLISQREIGSHVRTFAAALKDALREDPDVILVGEMRDPETIRLALTAAETGHLVLSTLHTRSAPQSIERIIDVFPAGEKETVRTMLAQSLQGIIAQQLVRCADQAQRRAVFEVLVSNSAVRNNIRENQTAQITSTMSTSHGAGMITLDQALTVLVRQGAITREEAARVAHDASPFSTPSAT